MNRYPLEVTQFKNFYAKLLYREGGGCEGGLLVGFHEEIMQLQQIRIGEYDMENALTVINHDSWICDGENVTEALSRKDSIHHE